MPSTLTPSCHLERWVRGQMPSSLPLAFIASFSILYGLILAGAASRVSASLRYCPFGTTIATTTAAIFPSVLLPLAQGCSRPGSFSLQSRLALKSPCCFSSGCPKWWPYLSCFLLLLSAELRGSHGGNGLPEHAGPPAYPCPLRLGLFLLQPDFLTIHSYWPEDWFPPGGSSCWTKMH